MLVQDDHLLSRREFQARFCRCKHDLRGAFGQQLVKIPTSSLPSPTITVGPSESDVPGFNSDAIQNAVSRIKRCNGGTIVLGAGVFELIGPIRLADRMTLLGSGRETVLRKAKGYKSQLVADGDYGETQIEVADATGFRVGMGLQVFDNNYRWGWDESVALITEIQGNLVRVDRRLQRDYTTHHGAMATNACSLISIEDASDVTVQDLELDGNRASNVYLGGCRGGCIYLFHTSRCRIQNVYVGGFNGDGISWQITECVVIDKCKVQQCSGAGLHPGTGSYRTVIMRTDSHHNDEDGLFICWRVQSGEFRANRFFENGRDGISIGHKDNDNLFESNEMVKNGRAGVFFRSESAANAPRGNRWRNNQILDNGGNACGIGVDVNSSGAGNQWRENSVGDSGGGRQRVGIRLVSGATALELAGNVYFGHSGADVVNESGAL